MYVRAPSCDASCAFDDVQFLQGTCGSGFVLFMSLVSSLLSRQCDIADPCNRVGKDGTEILNEDHLEFDFIIVGAGVAGPVVASRLSEDHQWRVLLVEAGPEEPTATLIPAFAVSAVGTAVDWNFTTVAQSGACLSSGGVCSWPRGKMVSGTGGMQGMMYTRGHRSIYDRWEELGNEGWGFDSVLPYFIKAENNKNPSILDDGYHGYRGPLTVEQFASHPTMAESVVQAAVEIGYRQGDLNGKNQTGANIAQMMVSDGLRGSTPRLYLRPNVHRTNLHVAINSHVTKVIIDSATKTATGVEILLKDGTTKTATATKEVILSGGTIGSAQLLLLSGIGPQADLEELGISVINDLPVGKNLINHVSVGIGYFSNDTSYQVLNNASLTQYLEDHTGPMSGTGLTQTTAFLKSKYATDDVPDLQVFFDGFIASCSETGEEDECTDGSISTCSGRYIYSRPTNIQPKSVGSLKLKSTNPLDHPLIDPQYLTVDRDVDVLVEGLKLVIELSKTKALQKWGLQVDTTPVSGCESSEWGSDEYFACVVRQGTGPENHQVGTCRMGPNTNDSVVDPQLRVHGISSLRVVDASIFPYPPNSNPISAIIMAAEKASDLIKATWNSTPI